MKHRKLAAAIALFLTLSVTACTGQASASTVGTTNTNDTSVTQTQTQTQNSGAASDSTANDSGTDAASKATVQPGSQDQAPPDAGSSATPSNPSLGPEQSGQQAISVTPVAASEVFSDRDYSAEYQNPVNITLKDGASSVSGNGASVSGNKVTITAEGTYLVKGTLTDGQIIVDAADTAKIQIVLSGASITSSNSAAIYVKQADKVFVTLADGTVNTLETTGEYSDSTDTSIDGAVFSRDDITFNGKGTLNVKSAAGHALVGNDDLKITSGTYNLTAAKKGINGNDQVAIADGTVTINAGTEGIEASDISIYGGKIDIKAPDDGLNAVESEDGSITTAIYIYGGDLYINAGGDGIDSNGILYVAGGDVKVDGPTDNGNGALDHSGAAVTGGTVVAAGSAGMAQNFGSTSTQGSILATASSVQSAGTKISLLDSSGNEIVSYTPSKEFQSVVISSSKITQGSTYTLKIGSETQTIQMDSLIYGQGFGGPGGGGHGGGRGMKPQRP